MIITSGIPSPFHSEFFKIGHLPKQHRKLRKEKNLPRGTPMIEWWIKKSKLLTWQAQLIKDAITDWIITSIEISLPNSVYVKSVSKLVYHSSTEYRFVNQANRIYLYKGVSMEHSLFMKALLWERADQGSRLSQELECFVVVFDLWKLAGSEWQQF